MVEITFYETIVLGSKAVGSSQRVTLDIPDNDGDGAISRQEWSDFTSLPFGQLAGETSPPALFIGAGSGQTTAGILYSPIAYADGADLSQVLKDLDKNRYFPAIDALTICYLAGTAIATPLGERPVEELRAGDQVLTRDHGPQPLVWVSSSRVTPADLDLAPNKRPVRIARGALGQGLPRRDVDLSPQHRVMFTGPDGQEYLVSARHMMMAGMPGLSARPLAGDFTLHHIACAQHEILLAEGAPMESFYTGRMAVRALPLPQRMSLIVRFPQLAHGRNPMTPARPFITHRDLAILLQPAAEPRS